MRKRKARKKPRKRKKLGVKTRKRSRGSSGKNRRVKAHKNRKGRTPPKPRQTKPPAAPSGFTRETRPIPIEFVKFAIEHFDEYFESGYEAPDEDEY